MSTFKSAILRGSGHEKSGGTTNIKIKITHRRRADYITTDLYIEPDRFDTRSGSLKSGKNKSYRSPNRVARQRSAKLCTAVPVRQRPQLNKNSIIKILNLNETFI